MEISRKVPPSLYAPALPWEIEAQLRRGIMPACFVRRMRVINLLSMVALGKIEERLLSPFDTMDLHHILDRLISQDAIIDQIRNEPLSYALATGDIYPLWDAAGRLPLLRKSFTTGWASRFFMAPFDPICLMLAMRVSKLLDVMDRLGHSFNLQRFFPPEIDDPIPEPLPPGPEPPEPPWPPDPPVPPKPHPPGPEPWPPEPYPPEPGPGPWPSPPIPPPTPPPTPPPAEPWFYDGFSTLDAEVWSNDSAGDGTAEVIAGNLVLTSGVAGVGLVWHGWDGGMYADTYIEVKSKISTNPGTFTIEWCSGINWFEMTLDIGGEEAWLYAADNWFNAPMPPSFNAWITWRLTVIDKKVSLYRNGDLILGPCEALEDFPEFAELSIAAYDCEASVDYISIVRID